LGNVFDTVSQTRYIGLLEIFSTLILEISSRLFFNNLSLFVALPTTEKVGLFCANEREKERLFMDASDGTVREVGRLQVNALAIGGQSIGALAIGSLAAGALAVGAVAIGHLVIGRAKIKRLEIGELVVGQLRVTESMKTP